MQWHFLTTGAANGAYNMAFDESLMRWSARRSAAVFRVYGWSSPTLSLGRNQRARGLYDLATAGALGIGVVRRPTGGRALLHHREITYSAALPLDSVADARSAYDFLNGVLVAALRGMGARVALATQTVELPPGPRPCFDVPSEREIVFGDRKLVGSAQWRHGGALLQHGSILLHDDQPLIAQLLIAREDANPRAATLVQALGREPASGEVADALRASLAAAGGIPVEFTPDDVLREDIDRLSNGYRDDAWTWRR